MIAEASDPVSSRLMQTWGISMMAQQKERNEQ